MPEHLAQTVSLAALIGAAFGLSWDVWDGLRHGTGRRRAPKPEEIRKLGEHMADVIRAARRRQDEEDQC